MVLIQQLLGVQFWAWLLVLARVGAAFMVLPTIGDNFVNAQVRVALALMVSLLAAPGLAAGMPPQPTNAFALLSLLVGEILVGFFIAGVARILMSTLEVAGMIIAMQSGLSNAMMFNPAMSSEGSLPGALMGWLGLLLIFVTNLHHLLLMSVVDSYVTFPPGAPLPLEDMAATMGRIVGESFSIGVRMAAPFLATGLIFAFALGLLNKLAPQIQVFFLFMSAQVALGLILFSLTLSGTMLYWLQFFEQTLMDLLKLA